MFIKKPYLRTNYSEAIIEKDLDLKSQYRFHNLADPISIREVCSKNYVDNLFKSDIDFNDVKLENPKFVKVNHQPAVNEHLTPKVYVDTEINQPSLVRKYQDNDSGNYNLTNINTITLNKQAEIDNEVITKAYVDQFHSDNERNRRDLGTDFYDESSGLVKNKDIDFNDNNLTNINSITVNKNPSSDNELSNKKYVDDELGKNTIVGFIQTLQNYLKVSVRNSTYNLSKYDKIQIIDATLFVYPNTGGYLLQNWVKKCIDKNNAGKIQNFVKSTKTNSPTGSSGATSLPPISDSFMYIETSSNNHGTNVFCIWDRTDIIQVSNITIYYSRFSILTNDSLKAMPRFRIQLLLEENTWATQYNLHKNSQYSNSSTDWTLLNLDFTIENYGIKLILDEITTAHSDMFFSNVTITHSVY